MTIDVNIVGREYTVEIERGILQKADQYLNLNRKVLVVTDDGVPQEYPDTICKLSKDAVKVVLPQGEDSKCLANWEKLLKAMLDHSFTRSDCVVAVGGGVCGDLAGFVAASYMRGVDFYNIPTTVLSQVDSSIGGKTAIDFYGVKNIVGAFYQPKRVLIDPDNLKTLPKRQLANGLSEALKMSMTFDAKIFELFENGDPYENIETIIAEAVRMKRDVVVEDEKESGLRRVLNFGHTLGHGIEVATEEAGLYHGECVAIGMVPMCSEAVRERLLPVLKKLELPCETTFDVEKAYQALTHDKKAGTVGVKSILVEEIGTFKQVTLDFEDLKARLQTVCK